MRKCGFRRINVSKAGIHRLVASLEERGYIRRLPNRARAIEIIKLPKNLETEQTQDSRSVESKPAFSNDNATKSSCFYGSH